MEGSVCIQRVWRAVGSSRVKTENMKEHAGFPTENEIAKKEVKTESVNGNRIRRKNENVKACRIGRQNVKWQRPSKNWVKLNFDGASKGNPGRAGGGGVFRDDKGSILAVYAESYGCQSSYYAEARALFRGIQIAADHGWTNLEIEGDCMDVVKALNSEGHGDWKKHVLIRNARLLCNTFQEWKCTHVYREGNRLADVMANSGVYLRCNEIIVMKEDWPQVMFDLAKNEVAHSLEG